MEMSTSPKTTHRLIHIAWVGKHNSRLRALPALLFFALLAACSRQESPQLFEDVTLDSGLAPYRGMTYGAFWGDPNQDGWPDMYLTNHLNPPALYLNQGDGRFTDASEEWLDHDSPSRDQHGAEWADFDNDGLADLVQLTGAGRGVGEEAKNLYRNENGSLSDQAEGLGTQNPLARTRMPLFVDLDTDGRLDLIQGEESRHDGKVPPRVFLQGQNQFSAADASLPLVAGSVPFCVVTDLINDALPEVICRVSDKKVKKTAQVFDLSTTPVTEANLLPVTAFEDLVAGDFDNDGRIDLYLPRKYPAGTVALGQPSQTEVIGDISIYKSTAGKPAGFRFLSDGFLDVVLVSEFPKFALKPSRVHIGQEGLHPGALRFSLSAATAGIEGLPAYEIGSETGVYIGRNDTGSWEVHVDAPTEALRSRKMRFQHLQVQIRSSAPITDLETIDESGRSEQAPDRLFMNRSDGLVEESDKRGINDVLSSAVNAVAGDFDNDMDLDLFIVNSGDAGNRPNQYLQNDGKGYFDVVAAGAGAAGPLSGVGDSVSTADFDGDGFLDLLVADGGSMGRQMGLPSDRGGYRLYRNTGNDNHWLMIDLQGVTSNRDGIGARVEVTAGGVTQVRVQDGGIHNKAQNHARLHFGLAENDRIDKVAVFWPGGRKQTLQDLEANQVLKIVEE